LVDAIRREPNLELVLEGGDGSSTSRQIAELAPDMAVIDLHMLGFDGLRLLERLSDAESETRVLILSGDQDGSLVYQAIEAGAAGCLPEDAGPQTICDAIASVARGERVFAPELVDMLAEQIRGRRRGGSGALTERQRTILRLTADGLSAEEVASELAVSMSTVKKHLSHAYARLGVSGAAAAVYEAMRLNILS